MKLDFWQRAAPALSAVWTMTAGILVGAFVGGWLDERMGTAPFLKLGLALGGLFAGSVRVVRGLQQSRHDPPLPPDP